MAQRRNQTLAEFRKDILDSMDVSYDYYPAYDGIDNHCRWICTDIECDTPVFKSFPALVKHLKIHHDISFCEQSFMRFIRR